MRELNLSWKIILGIAAAMMVFPIVAYWMGFGAFRLSNNFEDWVDFSSYWSPFLIIALTIILAHISWQSLELIRMKEKPLLAIEEYPEYPGEGHFRVPIYYYKIKNLGQGPSLNMKLFIRIRKQLLELNPFLLRKGISNGYNTIEDFEGYHYMVHSFTLQPKEDLKLNWQFHVEQLALVYDDLYGNTTTVLVELERTTTFHYDTIKIDKWGKKEGRTIFCDGKDTEGHRLPKRIFSLGECYER